MMHRVFASSQRGLSMVEAMVAIVVLSIGVLGCGALQSGGLRVVQGSFYRAQAAQLATDMADRMRANFGDMGNYALALAAPSPTGTSVRDRDRAEWRARLRSLPAGNGAIDIDPVTNLVTITVQWDDSRAGGDAASSFVLVTRLRAN